jgi:outer membrane protein, multidrug efflux system
VRLCLYPLVVFAAGCASIPMPDHPAIGIVPPDHYTSAHVVVTQSVFADSVDAHQASWWQELGDTTLSDLVMEGLLHNRDLAAASHRLDAVQAQARMAGAGRLPQASAGTNANRSRRNFIGFPVAGPAGGGVATSTTTTYDASLLISWEVDLWGRLRSGHAAALADVEASQADFAGARLSLAAQVAKLYFRVIEARHQLDLARATAASQQSSAQQIEVRYARGLRTSLDLRLARSSAASAQAQVAARTFLLDGVTRQLEVLLGRYPAAALDGAGALPALASDVPAGLPADLIRRRPDLAAGERRLVASRLRVTEARRALLPRISLTASGGRSSDALGDLLDGDYSVWNLVGNLSQPLFQGGRLRAQVDLATAGQDAALAQYASTALRAFGEVETALVQQALLADQERLTQMAATEALAAERLAGDRYARGLSNYITLLESQRRAFEAQSQLLSVRLQRLQARIDLYVALGGSFESSIPPSTL